jgi:hypothetical protein
VRASFLFGIVVVVVVQSSVLSIVSDISYISRDVLEYILGCVAWFDTNTGWCAFTLAP